jgi:hypothetical protein
MAIEEEAQRRGEELHEGMDEVVQRRQRRRAAAVAADENGAEDDNGVEGADVEG